jgi:predicted O-linked N-acetylglucosamine transferase (SPINDLY family)
MTDLGNIANIDNWEHQAHQFLIKGDYRIAANLYEQAIQAELDVKSHYWYLGLLLLLQGQEAEAQTAWWLGMAEGEPEQVELWTAELVQVLRTEAERQESVADYQMAWAIRQHMRQVSPRDINNLLHIIQLSINLEKFTDEDLTSLGIINFLSTEELVADANLLLQILESILDYAPGEPSILKFVEACLGHAHPPEAFTDVIMLAAISIAYSLRRPTLASDLAELCLRLEPKNIKILMHLAAFYQDSRQYSKGIETAKLCYTLAKTLPEQAFANSIIIRSFMSATGYWEESCLAVQRQCGLLNSIIKQWPLNIDGVSTLRLFLSPFFLPYFTDNPSYNRPIQNKIGQLAQSNIEIISKELVAEYRFSSVSRPIKASSKVLKIGYISHCLRKHSVGWISRWIFQHHNRERFQIYAYMINQSHIGDFSQQWFVKNAYTTYVFKLAGTEVLERIQQDEIDIIVDLDSITLDSLCQILAIKPAPIQVTWLGWDASGLPSIDYFIADPYVLPDSAQDYYTETIWRLPQTYVAVDGFEVGVPSLRRDLLNINSDAVVYFVTQKGYKRHLDNARLQMRILKEVPNSYLLVKGEADKENTKTFFEQVAEEEGVACDRLRFLPFEVSEEVHRANLGIADIVLDTYPYNGATTTLETLWMGIPLVTRVGQQFAARNSYTMMMNVGVTEGIAWTDEEYVEWGVRLGKDAALRQQIAWKLRQSRQTAPLWNAKQFTREMEKAYGQMWQRYVESGQ